LAGSIAGKQEYCMPEQETIKRAHQDRAEGKSASTQAGEFVREEMHHSREGKHGARSTKQAIAIGLSKARRAGVKLPAPRNGSPKVRQQAAADTRATLSALKREGHSAASHSALSKQARSAARMRHRS
jgi:hypothetical protein